MNNRNRGWGRYGPRTGRPGAEPVPAEGPEVLVINERELRAFIFRVYLSSVVLCLLTSISWIILSALTVRVDKAIPVPPYVWLILAFILLSVLGCIGQTPALTLLCWGLMLGSLFFVTLFGAYYMHLVRVSVLLIAILVAGSLLALLHLYGAKSPEVLLPNIICTCCIFLLLTVTVLVLMILFAVISDMRYLLAVAIIFVIIIAFMAPFQARYVCGRLQQVPYGQTADCATDIHLQFCFLLACMLIIAQYYS
ncbi:uncharacterized protein LOC117147325 [Drosophila mauritiana]|uniref:Uncharacterized protein LOC117147325 n=1 Tax=Drosophila mauritiana TaxID=7226 RepID=A0A6P8L3S9_DROMA|nr:uncharacterized protein LOC117147325 [Drosophila mauritiana]